MTLPNHPLVAIVMGSKSDWPTMKACADALDELGLSYDVRALSAHRTPDALFAYIAESEAAGVEVIVAGAGGAAHLPGVVAAKTILPVLGVPMPSRALHGLDSLLSIVQMPRGIPVGTLAIGEAGAGNAGLFAAHILALKYPEIRDSLAAFRERQAARVLAASDPRES